MRHQEFWINYLQETGVHDDDWIYWLAYDDEIDSGGIARLIDSDGNWPLSADSAFLGPWKIRHESPMSLWKQEESSDDETWTCLEHGSNGGMNAMTWIRSQLVRPTYIQMSGSVMTFRSHARLVRNRPRKSGPMRIEMASVLAGRARFVCEFPEAVSIIYGRSDSDRSAYGRAARIQDVHLLALLLRRFPRTPISTGRTLLTVLIQSARSFVNAVSRRPNVAEEWRNFEGLEG